MRDRRLESLVTTRASFTTLPLFWVISCPRVNAKLPRRFPSAQTLDLYRVTNPPIKLHHLHPPPSAITPKGYLLPEFYSGATGPTGRFNEGFLLRRLHPDIRPGL